MHSKTQPAPPWNQDDDLIEHTRTTGRAAVRFSIPDNVQVVMGSSSRQEDEVHLPACRKDNVPVLRRRTGGGTVVLDPGNIIVSVALPSHGIGSIDRHVDRIMAWLINCLERITHKTIKRLGYSDLAIDGAKISGSGMRNTRDVFYFSATLLVSPDISLMDRYLKHPPKEPTYRQNRPHNHFVRAINPSATPADITTFLHQLSTTPLPQPPPERQGQKDRDGGRALPPKRQGQKGRDGGRHFRPKRQGRGAPFSPEQK